MAKQAFDVKAKDRHTGEIHTFQLGENENITSQAVAEVYFFTMPTAMGGKHPGFDVNPKDKAKFDEELAKWQQSHPEQKAKGETF